MTGLDRAGMMIANGAVIFGLIAVLSLIVLIPARTIQKRQGSSPWLLVLGLVPYAGPVLLLWGLALATPRIEKVVA